MGRKNSLVHNVALETQTKFEVGKKYLSRNGLVCTIYEYDRHRNYPYLGEVENPERPNEPLAVSWDRQGRYIGKTSTDPLDLTFEVKPDVKTKDNGKND